MWYTESPKHTTTTQRNDEKKKKKCTAPTHSVREFTHKPCASFVSLPFVLILGVYNNRERETYVPMQQYPFGGYIGNSWFRIRKEPCRGRFPHGLHGTCKFWFCQHGQFRHGRIINGMLLDVGCLVQLFFRWHYRCLMSWWLTIAIVGFQNCRRVWNGRVKTHIYYRGTKTGVGTTYVSVMNWNRFTFANRKK